MSSQSNKNTTAALQEKLNTEMLEHPSYIELQTKLTEAEEKVTEHWERILRMQADGENAARRAQRDIENAHKYGLEKMISELLPVMDSLDRAVETHADDVAFEGVRLTLQMFESALQKFGVESIYPVSETFNPELHQAVSMQEGTDTPPGSVISVLQKGYLLNKRLIRPALVIVAK